MPRWDGLGTPRARASTDGMGHGLESPEGRGKGEERDLCQKGACAVMSGLGEREGNWELRDLAADGPGS